jgi:hypothetical protein
MLLAKEGEFRSQKCVHSIPYLWMAKENKDQDKEGIGLIHLHQHINTTYYQIISINVWKESLINNPVKFILTSDFESDPFLEESIAFLIFFE